eukprot:TRINITY_DN12667_c0_g1_i1.p2 TRINITY_DN12667_c0_g1~~TRINITY_DN12667_c0_g1_i1.p2  ORF type:complete len:129 (-),score=17.14 TRINITY_DN12667_c0_g1_i1:498-884(-)
MIRRPPRSTQSRSSAASDVYKRQILTKSYARERRESDYYEGTEISWNKSVTALNSIAMRDINAYCFVFVTCGIVEYEMYLAAAKSSLHRDVCLGNFSDDSCSTQVPCLPRLRLEQVCSVSPFETGESR